MTAGSVSQLKLVLEINGTIKLNCELKRHLSPRTVGMISRTLPISGNAHLLGKSIAYLESGIDSGLERQRKEFKKGDIAYFPNNGGICFFFNDVITTRAMSAIGKIFSNVDELKNIKSGDTFSLYSVTG